MESFNQICAWDRDRLFMWDYPSVSVGGAITGRANETNSGASGSALIGKIDGAYHMEMRVG